MTCRSVRSGFSLVEIVVAVTIMGLVMAIIVPNVMGYLQRSRKTATRVALNQVTDAIELYHSDTSVYPATLHDLITRPADEKAAKRWDGPYFKKAQYPTDGWKNELVYILNPKGTQPPYELYSWGPGGEGSPSEEWMHARDV